MKPLTDEFLGNCPVDGGFRMRGEGMTRIEVFVDAAFAFALTLLVISFDRIPETLDEVITAFKGIPAFALAVMQLVWIWSAHSQWSERYGLRDTMSVAMSTALLIVMLIYIYPMRLMFEGLFWWASDGYFPSSLRFQNFGDVSTMFVFLGVSLGALFAIYGLMYRHALSRQAFLRLDEFEIYQTNTWAFVWFGSIGVCALGVLLAVVLDGDWIPLAGFSYALLGVWVPLAHRYRNRNRPARERG
jgi:uncharacterized membrane protein